MQENETAEMLKKKEEKKERKQKEQLTLIIVFAILLGGLVGYACGYHYGLFEGYQLCLKQFEIVNYAPGLFT